MRMERILLLVLPPYEGNVQDRVTDKFHINRAVKYMPLGLLSIRANIPAKYK